MSFDTSQPLLEVRNMSIRMDGGWLFRDFSLSLHAGKKATIMGPSGSGKTTVLRAILGLKQFDEGDIFVMGRPMNARNVWDLRAKMAYVAQEPDFGAGVAEEILTRPFDYRANAGLRDNLRRIPEFFRAFNLPESLLQKDMALLSGGEKQRVALISALLLDRPIILLDEASSALDQENKQAVAAFFKQSPERTVLSVSHDVEWLSFSDFTVDLRNFREAP